MREDGTGQSVPRTNDLGLPRGLGRYAEGRKRPLGIRHVDVPASPPSVWRAKKAAA
ncbi:MAG TPA: hypothetical protein VGB82_22115 [Alphaproteobacteria bacterium]